MTLTNSDVLTSARMGGEVRRYHTWPTIRQQTVMDHTGNVIRIYWTCFGSISDAVTSHLLFHDLDEVVSGDWPHPIKAQNPDLAMASERIRQKAIATMLAPDQARRVLDRLTDTERLRMKVADLVEMWEFAGIELRMGNQYAEPIVFNIRAALERITMSADDFGAVWHYIAEEILRD